MPSEPGLGGGACTNLTQGVEEVVPNIGDGINKTGSDRNRKK
jgi:hypothetical protein